MAGPRKAITAGGSAVLIASLITALWPRAAARPQCTDPPCDIPCGRDGQACCADDGCNSGLLCTNHRCSPPPVCGAIGQSCCASGSACTASFACSAGTCVQPVILSGLTATLQTTDEDKDAATGVTIAIEGLTSWSQGQDQGYPQHSTVSWPMNPSFLRMIDLAGRHISICAKPNGNDTWKFNFDLHAIRSDGQPDYMFHADNVFLSTDVPCLSWDATPHPIAGCGAPGQACCIAGAPCQGIPGCQNGFCTSDPVTVSNLTVALETTNEDKDADTHVIVGDVVQWQQTSTQHYDDWTDHRWPVTPGALTLAQLTAGTISLQTIPNGDDSWKLNFVLEGTRSDGGHFEFRKDNVWLSNDGNDALQIDWTLGPPPLDLMWNDTDPNGLPLNPTWRGIAAMPGCGGQCIDAVATCPYHPTPLLSNDVLDLGLIGGTPNDWGRCSSQAITYDRSSECGWHANWFPATFEGTAAWESRSAGTLLLGDEDYNINLTPRDPGSNLGNSYLHSEFDYDETVAQFGTGWWSSLRELVEDNRPATEIHEMIDGFTIMIGLVGIDERHGANGELHPVYVLAHLASDQAVDALHRDQTWEIFVRNWGNEGQCGASQHYLDRQQFTLFFPQAGATTVAEISREFVGGGPAPISVSDLSPVMHTALHDGSPRDGVELTFSLGAPEQHTFIAGEIRVHWTLAATATAVTRPAAARPATPPSDPDRESLEVVLTPDQVAELRRRVVSPVSPIVKTPVTRVPFVAAPHRPPQTADRTVPDAAKRKRDTVLLQTVCRMTRGHRDRPEICRGR